MESPDEGLRTLQPWASFGAIAVLFFSSLMLIVGWGLDVDSFKNLIPGEQAVRANTAFGLACAAASLLFLIKGTTGNWRRLPGMTLAGIVLVIGVLYLSEYVVGWNLGIDEFPFRDDLARAAGITNPGRPAPFTTVNLILMGLALMTIDVRSTGRWRRSELLVVPVLVVSTFALAAGLYKIRSPLEPAPEAKMALIAALCFILIGVSTILARPRGRLFTLATTRAPGGVLARHMAPLLILLPLLLGWARLKATGAGVIGENFGAWLLTVLTIEISVVVLWLVAARLNQVEAERRLLDIELQELANRDALTGLWNRRRFREQLEEQAIRTRRHPGATAVLVIDLDSLKDVNDRFGHLTGDVLLAKVGQVIRRCIRMSDVAGRLGGDEFAVMLVGSTERGAAQVAGKICTEISLIEVDTPQGPALSTASVGAAQSDDSLTDDGESFLSRADQMMYEAKRAGGNRVVVYRRP